MCDKFSVVYIMLINFRISNTTQDLVTARRLIRRYFTQAQRFNPTDAIFATWNISYEEAVVRIMHNVCHIVCSQKQNI